jgi:hypothetical protein
VELPVSTPYPVPAPTLHGRPAFPVDIPIGIPPHTGAALIDFNRPTLQAMKRDLGGVDRRQSSLIWHQASDGDIAVLGLLTQFLSAVAANVYQRVFQVRVLAVAAAIVASDLREEIFREYDRTNLPQVVTEYTLSYMKPVHFRLS